MVLHYVKEHYAIHPEDKKQTEKVAWSKKIRFPAEEKVISFFPPWRI